MGNEMDGKNKCPLCGNNIAALGDISGGGLKIDCKQCGHFAITGSLEAVRGDIDQRLKEKIGFWTRDQNDLGELPVLGSYTAEQVKRLPDKTIMERAERLLRYCIRLQRDLGKVVFIAGPEFIGITHSRSDDEVWALAELLEERGWLRNIDNSGYYKARITPAGFMHATEAHISDSVNGFIAMWFDASMNSAKVEGFEPAIRAAGYIPTIVSGVEHINKIDDEIVSQIRKSKFVVADFTGHRGGVYFEAGFAMGLGLPVFWTCRKDDLAKLHFDIRQYNCIDWIDTADLSKRLKRRIEAIVGVGPIKPP
jgi:hypothetical protein